MIYEKEDTQTPRILPALVCPFCGSKELFATEIRWAIENHNRRFLDSFGRLEKFERIGQTKEIKYAARCVVCEAEFDLDARRTVGATEDVTCGA